jgi:hypothetical protein
MFGFLEYIVEGKGKNSPISTKNPSDSYGKIHEILVGKHLNGGNFPEDYRVEGKRPVDIHDAHAVARFGKKFQSHEKYKSMDKAASEVASKIKSHLSSNHSISPKRTAWTSQASDHEKETGVKDSLNKADLIVTGAHKGDHTKGKKAAISLKYGALKKTNYSNPGLKTLGNLGGKDLTKHQEPHRQFLKKVGSPSHEEYKVHPKKKEIEASSKSMTQAVAKDFAEGVKKKYKTDNEMKSYIKRSAGASGHVEGGHLESGKTHLPHVIAKTKVKSDGSHEHHVIGATEHVHNYLSHFKDLHVSHKEGQTSVAVFGTHKKTGKKMEVHRISIYMGGQHETANPRGATQLGSEHHASIDTSKEVK